MDKIILIGGAPTAGKSHTARLVSTELKMPWISTDTIREQMRKIVRKNDYPALFNLYGHTSKMVEAYLLKNSSRRIVRDQNDESANVWRGVEALIDTDYVWKSFIIEGVAVLPSLVKHLSVKNKRVTAVFLIDDNISRIRKTIFTRGLWDDADKYSDTVKEKEVEWVIEFNKYIIKEAKKYGFPVVKVGDRKKYLLQIRNLVK